MKNITLLFIGLVFSTSLFGQTENWYFSLSMGVSMPQGLFAEINTLNEEAGFAEKGFALSLDASYPVGDHWALKGMVLLNSNPVNRNGMGTMLESRMNEYFTVSEEDRDYLKLSVNSWMTNSMVFGPVFSINFNKFYWDFQALGGMNVAYLPQAKLTYENPVNNWSYIQRNTTSTSVSYGLVAGTALRFAITENVNLRLSVDYFYSQATVKYEELRVTKDGATSKTEILNSGSTLNPIQSISGTIGFVYYL